MGKWSHQHTLNTGLIVIGLLAVLSSSASLFASKVMVEDMAALAIGDVRNLSESQALRVSGYQEISEASASLLTGEDAYSRAARSACIANSGR